MVERIKLQTMRLSRFRLRTRIFLGFGLLIILLLGIAGFGSHGLSQVGQEIDRIDTITGNLRRAQEITFRLEVIRRGLTRYRIDADEPSLHEVIDAEQRVRALLDDLAKSTTSERRRLLYVRALESLQALSVKREQFVSLSGSAMAQAKALNGIGDNLQSELAALTAAVPQITDATESAAVSAAQVALMTVRIANLRFQAIPDAKLVASFHQAAANAGQALNALDQLASPAVKPLVAVVIDSLGQYIDHFEKASAVRIEVATLYDDHIRVEVRQLQQSVNEAQEELAANLDEISKGAAANASETLVRQISLSVAGTLAGIILAGLIARSIIRPVNGMTRAMTRLADGDTGSEVPSGNNTDEIGEMAKAVEVFRQQAIENVRLGGGAGARAISEGSASIGDGSAYPGLRQLRFRCNGQLRFGGSSDAQGGVRGERRRQEDANQYVQHRGWRSGVGKGSACDGSRGRENGREH